MCGIIGVAGWLGQREKTIFSNLLGWDVVRGHHATGVAAIRQKTNEIHILKRSMHAYDLMDLKTYEPTIDNSRVLIGHNRFGTVGGNSHRNAHPFVFDNVVGVHNGTIQFSDRKVLKDHDKFDTDSEAIYYNIGEFGPKEALKDLKGAWSLVWWDRVEQKLNFLRNKERPMYWTLSETKKEMYWASESPMLQAVLARHGVKHGTVYGTPEDTMLSFTIPDDYSAIEAPERTEVKGAAPFVFLGSQKGLYNDWEENWSGKDWSESHRYQRPTDTALPVTGIGAQKSLSDLRSMGRGPSSVSTPLVEKPSEKQSAEASSDAPKPQETINRGVMSDLGKSVIPFSPGHESHIIEGDAKVVHLKDKVDGFGPQRPQTRLVQIHKGFYAGREEFDKCAKAGCAYCEKSVAFADVLQKIEVLHWIARDAFLCDECMDDPDILEYLAGMNIELPIKSQKVLN